MSVHKWELVAATIIGCLMGLYLFDQPIREAVHRRQVERELIEREERRKVGGKRMSVEQPLASGEGNDEGIGEKREEERTER